MIFQLGGSILELCVLSIVAKEDTYGYKITQEVKEVLEVSESTLYPVLRRLTKDGYLSTYDCPYDGRNRRYYRITKTGVQHLEMYKKEWKQFNHKINSILEGCEQHD